MNARIQAPELPDTLEWVNSEERFSLSGLRGRVVLMHFYSYDSVNCTNALADVRYLENKYHDGLSVFGVHSPKYPAQRVNATLLKAVNRQHIRHPVANDADHSVWRSYQVEAWPTLVLIDAQGGLVGLLQGEGRRAEADTLITQLLEEAANSDLRVYESEPPRLITEPRTALRFPCKVLATDTSIWVADSGHNRLLECNHEGRILRQFGSGNPGYWDGANENSGFTDPAGMSILKDSLYVADAGNHAVRRIRLLGGEVDTVIGTGALGHDRPVDNPQPTKVAMSAPMDVVGLGDKLYVAVSGQNQLWQLDLGQGRLRILAGTGKLGVDDGDGGQATFAQPSSLSILGQQLVVADSAASGVRVVRLLDNRVNTIVGAGLYEFGDAAGKRDTARLQHPLAICVDHRGLIFIADSYNNKIKALNLRNGEVRALNLPYKFLEPAGLSLAAGALWVANTNAHEIVRVDLATGKAQRLPIGE
jgi:peroxiredoxin